MLSQLKRAINGRLQLRRLQHKYLSDLRLYNQMARAEQQALPEHLYPCLYDATEQTEIEPIYFYQDAWAFEEILKQKPLSHIDIGSSHRFVSFLSKCTALTMVDIRPLSLPMSSIKFIKGDLLHLPFQNGEIGSLSSICVIEHIGLGRYGDQLDPGGTEKAAREIDRVLRVGAHFYFSVPVEKENKTYFNAHRSFSEAYLLQGLFPNYTVLDRRYIYGYNFTDVAEEDAFGVGCYHLLKTR